MEEIINALLDVVREQQRNGVPPEAAMSRSDVVNMALKMQQQQGVEIEQETVTDTWRAVLRMAPKLFGSDTSDVPPAALSPSEQIIRHMEPDKKLTDGNENIQLDKMIFNNFQSMLGGAGGEIKTDAAPEPAKPAQPARPKSAAELAEEAIRIADENKRKGIKPAQPKPGQRRPVTNRKPYKGIPKASNTIKGDASQGVSASQLAYEAQKKAEARAREEARLRAELEEKMAQEAMKRGEPDPRIAAAEEQAKREAAEREMELKRAQEQGVPAPEPAGKKEETAEERRARVEAEQEARRAREWAEAEAEAKAAKERARAERDARIKAEEERAKAEKAGGKLSEEAKAAQERAARREKARAEAQAAKEEKSAQTRLEAAKLIQERAQSKTKKAEETTKKAVESIQKGMAEVLGNNAEEQLDIDETELNQLVMKKYQEMIKGGTKASEIDMVKLTSLVVDALKDKAEEEEEPEQDLDDLIAEAWGDKEEPQTEEVEAAKEEETEEKPASPKPQPKKEETKKVQKEEAPAVAETSQPKPQKKPERKPRTSPAIEEDFFSSIKNAKSFMGELENFLNASYSERRIHTGIEPVDQLLAEGLEPGVYMVQADESIGADSFQLQAGDYIASQGKDVLYLLSDSSRYGMMVKSISRLTYELRGMDKGMARSQASIMNCQSKADMANLRKEFAYYEEKIGEHLYLLEQKTMDSDNITQMIEKMVTAFRNEKQAKPVVFIDDIYWMLQNEDELLADLAETAEEIQVPIVISIGAGKYEDEELLSTQIQIHYTGVKEDADQLLQKELQAENGETLLANLAITKKDTGKRMSGKMAVTPKFHHFTKASGGK